MLASLTALVFAPYLFARLSLYWGDFGIYFHPLIAWEKTQMAQGILPLWNPLVLCGTPFVGNPQMWPLYPSTLLLSLFPASQYLTIDCVLHFFLAALFTFLFLRHGYLRLGWWPSLLGAVGYGMGSYLVTKSQYPNMAQALAYVPLVLLCLEGLIEKPGARKAFLLSLALGLQLLAAHAQVTLYTLYFALTLAVFRLWGQSFRFWMQAAGWGIVSFILAAGLSCGEWLPVLEAKRFAARQTLSLSKVDRLHLPLDALTNFILPYKFGLPLHGNWSGAAPLWETACFAGTVTAALAVIALLRHPARRETGFWLTVFVVSTWLATGTRGGLFPLAYHILPGMKLFHDPARLLLGGALALPVLAALGLQTVLRGARMTPRSAAVLGAACVLLTAFDVGAFDRQIYPLKPVAELEAQKTASPVLRALGADPVLQSGQGRILTVDDITAATQFQSWTDYEQDAPNYIARLADTGLPNLPMLAGLHMAGGYEPLARIGTGDLNTLAGASVRDVLYYRDAPAPPVLGLHLIERWKDADGLNQGNVYRNERFMPRARLQTATKTVPATVMDNTPDSVTVAPSSPHDAGRLILLDTQFAGWQADMDGQSMPSADPSNLFRTVDVSPGAHAVTWIYRPTAWRLGLYVSLFTLSILGAGGVFCFVRRDIS